MTGRQLEILLLCDYRNDIAATVRDHILALEAFSRHRYWRLSMLGDLPAAIDLCRFDAIVVHYTLFAWHEGYLSQAARRRIAAFRGLKAIFVQDEYRHVDASIEAMREMGIGLLLTCVPTPEIEKVYPDAKLPGVTKVNVLTGYVPEGLVKKAIVPLSDRNIDIGYRSRRVAPSLGRLGQEKFLIGERVREDARKFGLSTDISCREEDRLYGDSWTDFLSRCRATLGVESGASVFDFSGDIQKAIEAHLRREPNADFDKLHSLYLADAEGKIRLAQISPRCFEAAALGTLMILYEGEYSGILRPWRHYVPLKKDHSNFREVVEVLRDPSRVAEITDRAREEIALNPKYSFKYAISELDRCIESLASGWPVSAPYTAAEFYRVASFDMVTTRKRAYRWGLTLVYKLIFRVLLARASPAQRDRVHAMLRRGYALLAGRTQMNNPGR